MIPTRTGKPGKMGEHFPVREKSGDFAKTANVREFYPKYWKIRKKLYCKFDKNTGKVGEICQPVIVEILQIWYHTLNEKRTSKKSGRLRKILESRGIWQPEKVGTMIMQITFDSSASCQVYSLSSSALLAS